MAAPHPVPLDELRLQVVVDNLTDTLSSIDEGLPHISESAQLAARLPAVREYQGQWAADQSAECIKALNGPGGQEREITVSEPGLGMRNLTMCNVAPGGLICTNARIYSIDK